MMKDSEVKKLVKNFNKYAKGLRPDGMYVLQDDMIYSAIINDIHGTPGAFCLKFIDNKTDIVFDMLGDNVLIDGSSFNRVLSGTGLSITLDDNGVITKVENKTEIWQNENHSSVEKTMLSKYNRYSNFLKNIEYSRTVPIELISELIDMKNFIINLCDYIDFPGIDILKISNKSLKNFTKTTVEINIDVSISYNDMRVVRFIVIDDITETHSIYGLLAE